MKLREEQKLYKEARETALKFIGKKNVTDIEFGFKRKNEEPTDELSLRFKVTSKISEKELKKSEIIPKKAGKFVTDVILDKKELQSVRNVSRNNMVRPLIGGTQIQSSLYEGNPHHWGTMGCYLNIANHILGFTNYHVLYGGTKESIVANYYIGQLAVYQNIFGIENRIGTASQPFSQSLDYATFILDAPFDLHQSINGIPGLLDTYVVPRLGMSLMKSGARTGITYGKIEAKSCFTPSEICITIDPIYHQSIDKISDFGDSGSVWTLNENIKTLRPVALHYEMGENHHVAKAKTFVSIFSSIRNKLNN